MLTGRIKKEVRLYTRPKIFCLSNQRTGTTSVGDYFRIMQFKVAGWTTSKKNNWSYLWWKGDFESIFNSNDFKNNTVFEDDPWWLPEFYKILYHRFPNSKFILMTRDSSSWFKSMLNHSEGKSLGNTRLHAKVYRREREFYELFSDEELKSYDERVVDNLLSLEGQEKHYTELYELRNKEIIDFFNRENPDSLFYCKLEDPDKWQKLSEFFKLELPKDMNVHSNKTK